MLLLMRETERVGHLNITSRAECCLPIFKFIGGTRARSVSSSVSFRGTPLQHYPDSGTLPTDTTAGFDSLRTELIVLTDFVPKVTHNTRFSSSSFVHFFLHADASSFEERPHSSPVELSK